MDAGLDQPPQAARCDPGRSSLQSRWVRAVLGGAHVCRARGTRGERRDRLAGAYRGARGEELRAKRVPGRHGWLVSVCTAVPADVVCRHGCRPLRPAHDPAALRRDRDRLCAGVGAALLASLCGAAAGVCGRRCVWRIARAHVPCGRRARTDAGAARRLARGRARGARWATRAAPSSVRGLAVCSARYRRWRPTAARLCCMQARRLRCCSCARTRVPRGRPARVSRISAKGSPTSGPTRSCSQRFPWTCVPCCWAAQRCCCRCSRATSGRWVRTASACFARVGRSARGQWRLRSRAGHCIGARGTGCLGVSRHSAWPHSCSRCLARCSSR
jgi:hypothetical protein